MSSLVRYFSFAFLFTHPQYDKKGRNYLHRSILGGDVETVLFLISVNAKTNIPVQDSSMLTPLHLAVQAGSENIVRHLVSRYITVTTKVSSYY